MVCPFFLIFFQITLIMNKLKNLLFIVFLLMAGMVQGQDVGYYANSTTNGDYMYKTTDSGQSWNLLLDPATIGGPRLAYDFGGTIAKINFVSADIGYALVRAGDQFNPNKMSLFKTTDGGQNWTKSIIPMVGKLDSITGYDFVNNTGYIFTQFTFQGSTGNKIHKTTDGGQNWATIQTAIHGFNQDLEIYEQIIELQFVSANVGFYVTVSNQFGASLKKTIDGGQSWFTPSGTDLFGVYPFKGFDMINDSIGYVTRDVVIGGFLQSRVIKTIDGGKNWTTLYDPNTGTPTELFGSIQCFDMVSENVGYAVNESRGYISYTTNGGQTWSRHRIPNTPPNQYVEIGNTLVIDFVERQVITAQPKLTKNKIQVTIFPNPTNGITTITTENYQDKNYVVMSLTGQVLLQNNLSDTQTTIDLAALQTKGAYIILIRDTQTQQVLDKNIVIYK